jgi:hypothetical protein
LQHRAQVEGREADDLQHFGGRGLPGERFVELTAQLGVLPFEGGSPGITAGFQ